MRFILDQSCRLRGWTDHLACLERLPGRELIDLSIREYGLLSQCDGSTDIDADKYGEAILKFTAMGVIREAGAAGSAGLLAVQRYRFYENRCFRKVNLAITGYCDFKCKHCFNAADSSPRNVQPATDDIIALLGRLDDCGIAGVRINGGEPLLNRDFLRITDALRRRGMIFHELTSNVYHMTPDIADAIHDQGHTPDIFISFDGLGHHDWLRGMPGAERRALENIAMLKSKGFFVHVHCCVWRDSLESIRPTALKLQELGVDRLRITTIEPSVRWVATAPDQSLEPKEWLEYLCELLPWWYENSIDMSLDVWSFWKHRRGSNYVNIVPDGYRYRDRAHKIPACADGYAMPFIDCDGRIMLCLGLSGITKAYGIDWGNVYTDDLHKLLREGPFIDQCGCTVGHMKDLNPECRQCEWVKHCQFGCRAEALAQGNGLKGIDRRMCVFFKEGYYQRFKDIADRYGLSSTVPANDA